MMNKKSQEHSRKMRRAKTPSCRRYSAEKEMSVHILCKFGVGKGKDADLGLCQDRPGQIKETRLRGSWPSVRGMDF